MSRWKGFKKFVALFVAAVMLTTSITPFTADVYADQAGAKVWAGKSTYTVGEPLDVHQTGVGEYGWIGIYKWGETPSSTCESYFWFYTPLSMTPPGSNILEGNANARSNGYYLPAGEYQLFLFHNDTGYEVVARSSKITVVDYSISVSQPSGTKCGNPINVTVNYNGDYQGTSEPLGTSHRRQWVGLFRKNDPYQSGWALYWYYLSDWDKSSSSNPYYGKGTANILNCTAGWTDEYGPGEYKLVLFHSSRTDTNGNYKDYAKTLDVSISGHDLQTTTTAATCVAPGNTNVKCKGCTYETNTSIAINNSAHDWNDWVTNPEPTCTTNGTKTRTCKRNANHKETQSVPKLSHGEFKPVAGTPKTCTTDGIKAHYECGKNCGTKFQDAAGTTLATAEWLRIPASHNLTQVSAIAPKCEENGRLAHWHCNDCGKNFSNDAGTVEMDSTVDPMTGHDFTYTASGKVVTQTCKNDASHTATAVFALNEEYTYTGNPVTPVTPDNITYNAGWKEGKLDVSYLNNTNVGDATLIIKKNGNEITKPTFKIKKASLTGIGALDVTATYDGTAYGITVTGVPEGATVSYTDSATGIYETDNLKFVNAGEYTVYYKVVKTNYEPFFGTAKVTINQAANGWETEPSIADWTYGQTAKTPVYEAKFGNSTTKVEYRLASGTDADYTENVPTEAGSYLMRVTVPATENYEGLSATDTFEINRVKLTLKADDANKVYGEADPDKFTYSIASGSLIGSDALIGITVSRAEGEDADTYDIIVSQATGANLNYDITFVKGIFSINQKEIDISWGPNMSLPYDGTSKVPAATATNLEAGDTCDLTTEVVETTAGAGIIPGNWKAKVTQLSNPNYKLPTSGERVEVPFHIMKGFQDAPAVAPADETIDAKADGKITGLTTEMEWKPAAEGDDKYQKVTDPDMTFADGKYDVRYAEKQYYNPSPATRVEIKPGRMLTVTVPDAADQVGYTVATDDTELSWNGDTVIRYQLQDGYSEGPDFAVKSNGTELTREADGTYLITDAQEDIVVTVEGVVDVTAPEAEIKLNEHTWDTAHDVDHTLYYKDAQSVTIAATDTGSDVDKILYYLAEEEMTPAELAALADSAWTEYDGPIAINPQDEYIVYAKVTDKAGNVSLRNSDLIIVDNIAPVIAFDKDETYYGDTTFGVTDAHLDKVFVDGKEVTLTDGKYTIDADNKEHIITAVDKSGNQSDEIKVTIIAIDSLDDPIEDLTTDNVKSSDKEELEEILEQVEKLIEDKKDYTDEEDKQLEDIKKNIEELLDKIEEIQAEMKDIKDKIDDYDEDTVKCTDREDIEKLVDRADDLLKTDNLTDAEKKEMEDVKEKAKNLIEKIESKEPAHHIPGKDANCTDPQKCTHCDKELVPALGHDMKYEVTKEPTCTEEGERTYSCQRPGCDHKYTEKIPALGHDMELVSAVDPECEKDGNVEHYHCDDCDKNFEDKEGKTELPSVVVPMLGHNYKAEVTKEPTEEEEGVKTYTCQNCGHSYTEAIPKLPAAEPEPEEPDVPTTGDANNIWMWLALLLAGSGAAVYTEKRRRQQ